jgi:hypothetical protein
MNGDAGSGVVPAAKRMSPTSIASSSRDADEENDEDEDDDDEYDYAEHQTVAPPVAAPMGAWSDSAASATMPSGIRIMEGDRPLSQQEIIAMIQQMMESGEFDEEDLQQLEGLEVLDEKDDDQLMTGQNQQVSDLSDQVGIIDLLTPDTLTELLHDETSRNELQGLIPDGHSLADSISSAQLQAAMRTLTEACYSDEIDLLFTSLQLDDSVGLETTHPLKAFCLALQKKHLQRQP